MIRRQRPSTRAVREQTIRTIISNGEAFHDWWQWRRPPEMDEEIRRAAMRAGLVVILDGPIRKIQLTPEGKDLRASGISARLPTPRRLIRRGWDG